MTSSAQHPIGSGFDARSTADDVLAGIDLDGTTALVTGGASGLGLEVTRTLARAGAGATVVVPARRVEQATRVLVGLPSVEIHELDLADPRSIDRFAEQYQQSGQPLDLVMVPG